MEILPFDGNLQELAQMINRSWPREHRTYNDYSMGYLRHLMDHPRRDPDLTLGGYHKGRLICFIFSVGIEGTIGGRRYRVLLNSLATTDFDHKHLFPYLRIKDFCVKRAIESGYDLNAGYAVQGIQNNQIEIIYARRNGFQCLVMRPFASLVYAWRGKMARRKDRGSKDLRIRPYRGTDLFECLSLMRRQNQDLRLRQEWDEVSLHYKLSYPEIRYTDVIEFGDAVNGFINSGVMEFIYPNYKRRILVIDNFFIGTLPQGIQREVLRQFLERRRKMNLDGISLPAMGYFDPVVAHQEGFQEMPFRKSQTRLFLTVYRGTIRLSSDADFYLEIL